MRPSLLNDPLLWLKTFCWTGELANYATYFVKRSLVLAQDLLLDWRVREVCDLVC